MESMASVQFPMWAIMAPNASSTSVPLADEREGQEMEMIGIIGISHKPENVGYKIHPDHWGKGYMTEALRLFVEMFWTLEGLSHLLFRILKLKRCYGVRTKIIIEKKSLPQIRAAYTPGNDASARVLEKVGFQTGELLRGEIELWFNRGQNRKSDIQCMYIDRPRSNE